MAANLATLPVISSVITFSVAKRKALQLISAFENNAVTQSVYYPKLNKSKIIDGLKKSVRQEVGILAQKKSSLCGPAAFFFTLVQRQPDLYVQVAIDLYTHGKATLGKLKLQSSSGAKNYVPIKIRPVDWMVLSSINPEYDNPSEQLDGITFPSKLKTWFLDAGYKTVVDHTNILFPKDLQTLLRAQIDYESGSAICLLVDYDVFLPYKYKVGSSLLPNHWVALNSAIQIRKY